jgi:hypothetical protein
MRVSIVSDSRMDNAVPLIPREQWQVYHIMEWAQFGRPRDIGGLMTRLMTKKSRASRAGTISWILVRGLREEHAET